MRKKRVFLSGDRQQLNFDHMFEEKDGNITIVEMKHHGMSAKTVNLHGSVEHIVPRNLVFLSDTLFNEPESARNCVMPEIGQKLLPFILPKKLRETVAGDLAEDFRTYATQWGRPFALRWLWWELGGLCIRRFGPTAIFTAVAMWFRQKLGW
jgi:hypothetical protein